MPVTNKELDKEYAERLFNLLKIKKANGDAKNQILDDYISMTMAAMSEEQIAWVEKNVNR